MEIQGKYLISEFTVAKNLTIGMRMRHLAQADRASASFSDMVWNVGSAFLFTPIARLRCQQRVTPEAQ
jgi:hypothetical protein